MAKPTLLLIHPGQDKDRIGSKRRRKSSIPKLNLPLLAARADHLFDIKIVDESIEDVDFNLRPDLVGITVITQVSARAYQIADRFRAAGVPVVMGGFHVSFFPEEALEHCDAIVIGEAEGAWDSLIEDFLGTGMKRQYKSETPHDLVGLPKPRLDLVNRKAYSLPNVIETARGCPHACSYCAVSQFWGRQFRFRPIDEVVEEIKSMPPGYMVIVDDNIAGSPNRAKKLFEAMIPLKRKWYSQADIRVGEDPELLDLAARSGCEWLFIGIESVNDVNLAAVGKSRVNSTEKFKRSLAAIRGAGIKVFGSFIFGFDDDDPNVFDNTVRFCEDNKIEGANFYIFTPLPFTQLYEDMSGEGRILHHDWSRYDMNHVVYQPKKMSPSQLLEGYLKAYRRMYSAKSIFRRMAWTKKDFAPFLALNVGRRLNYKYFEEGCRI